MPTTPNMGLIMPTEDSVVEAGTWDTILNTLFGRIDIHDHTTGLGLPIPSAALKINADVAWSFGGTNYAVTSLRAIDFAPSAAATVASYAGALFVNSDDANNLYFRTQGGTNVRIINGNVLDAASVSGGIGGDYASSGALVDFVDGSDLYRLRQQSGAGVRQYAKTEMADLLLYEYKAHPTAGVPANAVTLKSPAALAAGYSMTMPPALPAGTAVMMMSAAGVMSVAQSPTLAANQSFEVSGTGKYKHGNKVIRIPIPYAGARVNGGALTALSTDPLVSQPASTTVYYPLPSLPPDFSLVSVAVQFGAAPAVGVSMEVIKGTTTWSSIGSPVVTGDGVSSTRTITISVAQSSGDYPLWLQVTTAAATTASLAYFELTYAVA
jgi:hypothetical protein